MKEILNLQAVLFDLDGVLIDSGADIAAAVNAALTHFGYKEEPYEVIIGFVGDGAKNLLIRALDYQGINAQTMPNFSEFFDWYVARYRSHAAEKTILYKGVYELLEKLKKESDFKTFFDRLFFRRRCGARAAFAHQTRPRRFSPCSESYRKKAEYYDSAEKSAYDRGFGYRCSGRTSLGHAYLCGNGGLRKPRKTPCRKRRHRCSLCGRIGKDFIPAEGLISAVSRHRSRRDC